MSSPQQSYNTYGSRNDRAFARGRTQWAGMSIDEILDVLSTMEPGRASGDVETILKAIESVRRAAERMHALDDEGRAVLVVRVKPLDDLLSQPRGDGFSGLAP